MTIDVEAKVKKKRAKPTVCTPTPDFLISNNDKQQFDPLAPFVKAVFILPTGGVCLSSMEPTRSTLVTRRSQLSHTDFDKTP